ncbi:MAG TPA: SIMPL domain-containing protein [Burkholderiaceae bacterium]|jgi:predicted secreted protein|nr:SIMPL domain-containing protein [Burkholderiaceae bacterium]
MTKSFAALVATVLVVCSAGSRAADAPAAPQGVVNLSASATTEVPRDMMTVTLSATRDGSDAAAVQVALKQALDAGLTEAKRAAKPGQVEVQTGNFALFPRYNKQNTISGWQGNAELIVEGRDMQAIAALAGRIPSMTIARVEYGLSRELRTKTEAELTAQAIANYRARAADAAKQFGYAGYTLREVSIDSGESRPPIPAPRMRAMAAAASDEALPVEAGKSTVSVSVSGSVQLTK